MWTDEEGENKVDSCTDEQIKKYTHTQTYTHTHTHTHTHNLFVGKDRTLFLRLLEAEKSGLITISVDPPYAHVHGMGERSQSLPARCQIRPTGR